MINIVTRSGNNQRRIENKVKQSPTSKMELLAEIDNCF